MTQIDKISCLQSNMTHMKGNRKQGHEVPWTSPSQATRTCYLLWELRIRNAPIRELLCPKASTLVSKTLELLQLKPSSMIASIIRTLQKSNSSSGEEIQQLSDLMLVAQLDQRTATVSQTQHQSLWVECLQDALDLTRDLSAPKQGARALMWTNMIGTLTVVDIQSKNPRETPYLSRTSKDYPFWTRSQVLKMAQQTFSFTRTRVSMEAYRTSKKTSRR